MHMRVKQVKSHHVEAPPPYRPTDLNVSVTKNHISAWGDGSTRSTWAHLDESLKELEEFGPSRWERRTFPGQQVVIDARRLPGTNHTILIKPLQGRLEAGEDTISNDNETLCEYPLGEESKTKFDS